MKKTALFIFISISFSLHIIAQNPKNIILDKLGFELELKDNLVIDSLVEQAFQNSYFLKTLDEERTIRQTKVWQEKNSWLSSFRFGVQLFNITNDVQTDLSTAGFLPSMGLTMQISPDKILTLPSRVKLAKSDVRRAENDILRQRKILRTWVEQKYLDYVQALEIVKLRQGRLESQLEMAILIQEKFKVGEAKLEEVLKIQGGIEQMEEGLIRAQIEVEKIYRELIVMTDKEST